MKAIAHEVLDPADVLQLVETALLQNDAAGVRHPVLHDSVGLRRSPIRRGAAYVAARDGEPGKPHV